jgi:ketosteroid isomerase-like protein
MLMTCWAAFLIIVLLGVAVAPGQEIVFPDLRGGDSAANAIFRLEDGAMEQWRRGNPRRWAEISADEISYVDPGLVAPIVGIEAYRKYVEPFIGKVHYDGSEYVKPRVALYGDLAVLTYNYHSLSKGKDGKPKRNSFWNTTEVYHRNAGQWNIVHTHWSYIQGRREGGGV